MGQPTICFCTLLWHLGGIYSGRTWWILCNGFCWRYIAECAHCHRRGRHCAPYNYCKIPNLFSKRHTMAGNTGIIPSTRFAWQLSWSWRTKCLIIRSWWLGPMINKIDTFGTESAQFRQKKYHVVLHQFWSDCCFGWYANYTHTFAGSRWVGQFSLAVKVSYLTGLFRPESNLPIKKTKSEGNARCEKTALWRHAWTR